MKKGSDYYNAPSTELKKGLEAMASGNKDEALLHYKNTVTILKEMMIPSDEYRKEKLQRQIDIIMREINKIEGSSKESDEKKLSELEQLGIEITKPDYPKLSDVAGMEDVKKEIMVKTIYTAKFPELAKDYNVSQGGGLILYGPPGNGKTFLARAIAAEASMSFIYVNPSSLFSQWFGNFEKNINLLFKGAKKIQPCILFFDEMDSLFPSRDIENSEASKRGVSQFLNELGGFMSDDGNKIMVMGATNVPWKLDPAITRPGRFDRLVYIPPPDENGRYGILRMNIEKIKKRKDIDIKKIASITRGYSGADLEYLIRYTAQRLFLRSVEDGVPRLMTTEDIIESMREVKPSLTQGIIERYERYQMERKSQ